METKDVEVTLTVSAEALRQWWEAEQRVYDCLGPAADDVFDDLDEYYPRAQEVTDALRLP